MNAPAFLIGRLAAPGIAGRREALANLLIACVADGGSLGYRAPLALARARTVFDELADVERNGQALVFTASVEGEIAGCVAIFAEKRETEPHIAELGKLMVHSRFRRHGIGGALVAAAERAAFEWGKTRLYLFTSDDGIAPAFYDRADYQRAGRIPEGGGLPDGTLVDALIFTKKLAGHAA
ncbi:GNAT family N-acetyltransferase [Acidiphilium sp. AL]|uniref:GNAT family N-acetyltransferase n=1 Tax=Acidiphilium sp. AL TaxID=2871704 RepID=UPI0021CB4FDD|nr:GNAT family N-acetyltransferase [Acidiphilium sp. AL]MCU4160837.1 GNAT family N-acetyltransferase [Acidiphilium sp. AL]